MWLEIMASSQPLKGIELIDCAKANAQQGIATAANLCGYGGDLNTFERELKKACQDIGVEVKELSDLITAQQMMKQGMGIEVAPDTPSEL
ncbi:hypothetical protein [Microcoleus sp. B3-D2]|uniref:hypothetical protein n=2 Tax=Microcoleaceae TaxID=1892252 RepID=UPI00403F9600